MARTAAVCLPHDWLTWRLAGGSGLDRLCTDRSDASGTGYWSPRPATTGPTCSTAPAAREPAVPRVLGPAEPRVRRRRRDAVVRRRGAPARRRRRRQRGRRARPRRRGRRRGRLDRHVRHGLRRSASAPTADATGTVAGFADATGRFLPLVCTLNAARVLDAAAVMLGVDLDGLSRAGAVGAGRGRTGWSCVPYLEGERTPNRPDATGSLHGLTGTNATPAHLARAAVEGMLCGLADGLDALRGARARACGRVLLIGGGARSEAVRRIAPAVFGVPVVVPEAAEYVADGAARQAAWALSGGEAPPDWALTAARRYESEPEPEVREHYAAARDA